MSPEQDMKLFGFDSCCTLFGNSICSDEINNTPQGLSALMAEYFGAVFPMGGIGGMPFAGKTGFKAFSAAIRHFQVGRRPLNGPVQIEYQTTSSCTYRINEEFDERTRQQDGWHGGEHS